MSLFVLRTDAVCPTFLDGRNRPGVGWMSHETGRGNPEFHVIGNVEEERSVALVRIHQYAVEALKELYDSLPKHDPLYFRLEDALGKVERAWPHLFPFPSSQIRSEGTPRA